MGAVGSNSSCGLSELLCFGHEGEVTLQAFHLAFVSSALQVGVG